MVSDPEPMKDRTIIQAQQALDITTGSLCERIGFQEINGAFELFTDPIFQ